MLCIEELELKVVFEKSDFLFTFWPIKLGFFTAFGTTTTGRSFDPGVGEVFVFVDVLRTPCFAG